MRRDDWTFEFTASAVAAGAAERCAYHRDRWDYWDGEIASAREAIQDAGLDVRSHDVTGGQRHEVVIDPTLANRLSEAQSKRDKHGRDADEYRDWHSVLMVDPGKRLTLDFKDVLYFGLGVNDAPEALAA